MQNETDSEDSGGILESWGLSTRVISATMLLLFSGLLIYFDLDGTFVGGIPKETIVVTELIYLLLVPLYLKRVRPAYVVGTVMAAFIAFGYRGGYLGPVIPMLQYFLGFFSMISFTETTKMRKTGGESKDNNTV